MTRIEIMDIDIERELSREEIMEVCGGYVFHLSVVRRYSSGSLGGPVLMTEADKLTYPRYTFDLSLFADSILHHRIL